MSGDPLPKPLRGCLAAAHVVFGIVWIIVVNISAYDLPSAHEEGPGDPVPEMYYGVSGICAVRTKVDSMLCDTYLEAWEDELWRSMAAHRIHDGYYAAHDTTILLAMAILGHEWSAWFMLCPRFAFISATFSFVFPIAAFGRWFQCWNAFNEVEHAGGMWFFLVFMLLSAALSAATFVLSCRLRQHKKEEKGQNKMPGQMARLGIVPGSQMPGSQAPGAQAFGRPMPGGAPPSGMPGSMAPPAGYDARPPMGAPGGFPGSGHPGSGHPQSGYPGSGHPPQSGYPGSGYPPQQGYGNGYPPQAPQYPPFAHPPMPRPPMAMTAGYYPQAGSAPVGSHAYAAASARE